MNLGGSRRPEARTLNSEGTVGQYTKKEQPLEFQITNVWTAGEERRGRKAAQSPTAGSASGGLFTTRNIFSSGSPAAGSVTPRLPRSPRLFSSQRSRSLSQSGTEGRYTSNAAQGMALHLNTEHKYHIWKWIFLLERYLTYPDSSALANFFVRCSCFPPPY